MGKQYLSIFLWACFLLPFVVFGQSDSNQIDLPYPMNSNPNNPWGNRQSGGLYLNEPANFQNNVIYDPETGTYNMNQTFGDSLNRIYPTYMDLDEYIQYDSEKSLKDYWKAKVAEEGDDQKSGFRPQLQIENEAFDRIFGGNTIDIRPQGSAELIFGVNVSRTDNPAIPEKQRRISTFDFNEKIQLSVVGNIGDKMKLTTSYNTEATFDFENQMKLGYQGHEDEIIQSIEAGNVTLPLKGSLITGSQSLFGLKTELKFGKLLVTTVFSQQKGRKQEIEVQGGAQINDFEAKADDYEMNKHFFLSHHFRDTYEEAVANPPVLASGINITKIEVWVTNTNQGFEDTRNIVAFQDLGEGNPLRYYNSGFVVDNNPNSTIPTNTANTLYNTMTDSASALAASVRGFVTATGALDLLGLEARRDYQKIELARKLTTSEFTVNAQLGYISVNQELNPNQVLAVAYQYTYRGQTYQVGEFSTDGITGQNALILKMLKSTEINTRLPMWDLMMKNVYAIGAYQVQKDGFQLEVWYLDASSGVEINYIPVSPINTKSLIQVLGLDKLNVNNAASPDGVFDFLDNPLITINPKNGRVYFPVLEPFSRTLRDAIGDSITANRYAFDSLYTTTQANAKVRFPSKNRFTIKGKYQSSSSSEITLNALNVPQGSVTVSAGGQQLTENQDYTVDYTLGRVKIINQGILESGTPIKISLESNSMFNIQSKTLFGSRFDYKVNNDLMLGGTIMNLTERPLTQKINIGDEPMSNTIVGFDGTYRAEVPIITTIVDKIPMINTKAKSTVTVTGEVAKLIPGHSKAVGKTGTSYIDDFEGSQSSIDIRSFTTWMLASTPQGQPDLFPEGDVINNLAYGFNRARLNWHVIDPLFFRNNNLTPDHIKANDTLQSNHFMREVYETEVFPNRDFATGQPTNIPVFDLSYFPKEKGPYNYDVDGLDVSGNQYGYGINSDGSLKNPENRWGGIMRRIETNDFDAANIEFIQFWLMDPFNEDYYGNLEGGDLYFNIGNISEDILKDGRKSFENGLPTTETAAQDLSDSTQFTLWGRVPNTQSLVNAFDNNPDSRQWQDVGLDGLKDEQEREFFNPNYLDKIQNQFGATSAAYTSAYSDPSADNYNYFRDDDYDAQEADVLTRYKKYNGLEGNSPSAEQSATLNQEGYPTSASTMPNAEDINRDNTLDDFESYFQYRVKISAAQINPENIGNNYITDMLEAQAPTRDGRTRTVRWYQFKIPIRNPEKVIGGIPDFRSIRFMRVFMKGFKDPVYLRFARLQLIRGEWRKYDGLAEDPGEGLGNESNSQFDVSAVNIEENGSRTPVNYVLPPGIAREINIGTTNLQRLNEQSLALDVCGLQDGHFEATYRNVDFDVRSYHRLKMFVHAEAGKPEEILNDGDLKIFVRMGSDFENNYYEYEVPLSVTQPGFYDPQSEAEREKVWPSSNNMDIDFTKLQAAKTSRNAEMILSTSGVTLQQRYMVPDGVNKIYIVGNPNLSTLKTIMVGIRNPGRLPGDLSDDGLDKCAEIWINELRLTDFNNQGGWGAIGRVTTKMADFATVSLAGRMTTPGFGSIEKKVSERQRETIQQVDASVTTELGQFLPQKSGIKVPVYAGFSQGVIKPQFDPLNSDIELNDALNEIPIDIADSIRDVAKDLTIRRSLNFTNVRKEKSGGGGGKTHIYDIENLSLSYSYAEIYKRNINIQGDLTKTYRGGLAYNYNNQPKNIKPFSKLKLLRKSQWLTLIKDANFYLAPKQMSFRTDVNRMYNERITRNTNPGIMAELPPFYNKNFTWDRVYDFKYDVTKAIKFDFNAINNALIGEPVGVVNKDYEDSYQLWTDSIRSSINEWGITTNYRHSANLNWTLPFNKIPITKFINSTARYTATYDWRRAPFAADSLGHTIQNTQQAQINGSMNFTSVYNKVPYLKKVNNKFRKKERLNRSNRNRRPSPPKAKTDTTKAKKKKDDLKITPVDHLAKLLMGFKNANVTYSQNNGLLLPGYKPNTKLMGMEQGIYDSPFGGPVDENKLAPGFGFIFGQQNEFGEDAQDFAPFAADKGWLVQQEGLSTQHTRTHTENLNLRASMEPINNLRVEVNGMMNSSLASNEFFLWSDSLQDWGSFSNIETGSYSVSYGIWRTAFGSAGKDSGDVSQVFEQFLSNRLIVSQRQAADRADLLDGIYYDGVHSMDEGYYNGYGSTSQDVLIPAFLSAYAGTPSNLAGLNPLKNLPKPNWRVTYTGLSKLKSLKKYFRTVTINHAYRSTMNVSSFTTNLIYTDNALENNGYEYAQQYDINANLVPKYQIQTVTLSEQFSPLINIDMTWLNSLQTRLEFKKDRNISLSLANTQITEIRGSEFVIGAGYIFKDVELPFKLQATGKKLKSDLNTRADVSVRSNKTMIRRIVEGTNQPTAGQTIVTIKFTADYVINERLNVRAFFDRIVTNPVTSQSFPTANTNAGVSIRFTLAG